MKGLKKAAETIMGFIDSMGRRHATAYAAQAAYFIILSFIPFMLLFSVLSYLLLLLFPTISAIIS